mgnify:CR=1 FL=1
MSTYVEQLCRCCQKVRMLWPFPLKNPYLTPKCDSCRAYCRPLRADGLCRLPGVTFAALCLCQQAEHKGR